MKTSNQNNEEVDNVDNEKDIEDSMDIIKKNSDVEIKLVGAIEKGKGLYVPDLGLKF